MALGCYTAAQQAGRPCPASLSIVGYNDMPFVEWWHPALTTVRIPQYDIGREAAHLLLEQILTREDGGRPAKQVLMPTSLTVRSSTGRCLTSAAGTRQAAAPGSMGRPARALGRGYGQTYGGSGRCGAETAGGHAASWW